jgi:hypothetical protein
MEPDRCVLSLFFSAQYLCLCYSRFSACQYSLHSDTLNFVACPPIQTYRFMLYFVPFSVCSFTSCFWLDITFHINPIYTIYFNSVVDFVVPGLGLVRLG